MFDKVLLILILVSVFSGCRGSNAESDNFPPSEPSLTTAMPTPNPTAEQQFYTSIRNVDFRNFEYSGPEDCSETFTLKNGEKAFVFNKEDGVFLNKVFYEDLTHEGKEEAVLRMTIQTGGTAIPGIVFVFTIDDRKLKTLWKFCTGDRAEGGLKDIYSKDGALIVEMFGENDFVNGAWESKIPEGKFKGMCCPTVYTKTSFRWNGERFAVLGTPETFDFVMTKKGQN